MKSRICAAVAMLVSAIQICRPDPLDVWTWRNPLPTGETFHSIAYGNGLFAATMDNGQVIYASVDGINWTPTYRDTNYFGFVCFGNGSFVAAGGYVIIEGNQYVVIHSSPDGVHWTKQNVPVPPLDSRSWFLGLSCVAYGNGIFVLGGGCDTTFMGTYDYAAMLTSADLANWSWSFFPTNVNSYLSAITYGNGRFVAEGNGAYGGTTFTSPDGVTWAPTNQGTNILDCLTYGKGMFAGMRRGGNTTIFASPDGVTWTPTSSGLAGSPNLDGIAYASGLFVAVGDAYDPAQGSWVACALTSTDCSAWVPHYSTTKNSYLKTVAYGNGRFAAGGDSGLTMTLPDGASWTQRSSAVTTATLRAITYANGQFVAAGDAIVTSTDGANWIWRSSDGPISGLAYGTANLWELASTARS